MHRSGLLRAPRRTARVRAAVAIGALALAGCGIGGGTSTSTPSGPVNRGSIVIGAFNFSESVILANMYADVLTKAGYRTTVKKLGSREVVEPALERGNLDVVPEYLATLTEFLNNKINGPKAKPLASPSVPKTLAALRSLAGPRGLRVLTPSAAADENAFAVTQQFAANHHLKTLSDLAGYRGKLILGGPPECQTRPFCKPGLEQVYGIHFTGFTSLDAGGPLTKTALQRGTIQIGLVFSSDGSLPVFGLTVLADNKHLQNADVVVPVVRATKDQPALATALDRLSAVLTTNDLVQLNKKVDIERQDPAAVARTFLSSKGLV